MTYITVNGNFISQPARRAVTCVKTSDTALKKCCIYLLFVAVFLGYNHYWPGEFIVFVVLCPGAPEGSTGSRSGFKASQKTGPQLKVSSDRLGEAGNGTCYPWFIRHRFIPYTTVSSQAGSI